MQALLQKHSTRNDFKPWSRDFKSWKPLLNTILSWKARRNVWLTGIPVEVSEAAPAIKFFAFYLIP